MEDFWKVIGLYILFTGIISSMWAIVNEKLLKSEYRDTSLPGFIFCVIGTVIMMLASR